MISYEIDMITFASLGVILLLIGNWTVRKVSFLWRFSIPGPVVGGFGFAIFTYALYEMNIVQFTYDNTLYDLAMYIFFVTIGLTTGLSILKRGGKILLIYMIVCWILALVQNGTSLIISIITGMDPLLALIGGQPALQGGHGMAGSMVPVVEAFGRDQALTVAMTAATFGLVAGSMLGGPIGNWLIRRHNIDIKTTEGVKNIKKEKTNKNISTHTFLTNGGLVIITLAIGLPTADFITNVTGFKIPGHIFSLFIGIIIRTLNDQHKFINLSSHIMEIISSISLNIFLVMAMMKLELWELANLALPLTILLITQTIVIILLAIFMMFRITGKNYDAAIMTAGFIGHGLGATPNGLVVMDALTDKYKLFSRQAFIIIPVAGTVLTDVVGVPLFVFIVNLFA